MSLCDHIPSVLDVFKVNFEVYLYKKYLVSTYKRGNLEIEHENISDVMSGKGT